MPLDELQRVPHGSVTSAFDDRGDAWVGDGPQGRHALDGGKGEIVAGDRLGARPRLFGDLPGQLPRIDRLPAMLGAKELRRHLRAHPGPVRRRYRPIAGQTGILIDGGGDLRHTCAALLRPKNVPARVVMEILGHSQLAMTTDLYSHVMPTALREAADAMDRVFVQPN